MCVYVLLGITHDTSEGISYQKGGNLYSLWFGSRTVFDYSVKWKQNKESDSG